MSTLSHPASSVQEIDHVVGVDSMGGEIYRSDAARTEESDAAWLARMEALEADEKARTLATYQPLPEDLEEYAAWSQALDAGTLTGVSATRFRFSEFNRYTDGEQHAIRSGQISEDELAMLAAHGCV